MASRKRSHCHTWTHINPVLRRVPRRVSINIYNNQDRTWFNIHATYYIKFTDTFSSSEYETSCYKPSLIDKAEAIKFESKVSNIVKYSAKIGSQSTKANRRLIKKPAQGLLLIHSGIEATLAITMIHSAICNMGNKTLSTRRYSARLTHHKPEIKWLQGLCKAV